MIEERGYVLRRVCAFVCVLMCAYVCLCVLMCACLSVVVVLGSRGGGCVGRGKRKRAKAHNQREGLGNWNEGVRACVLACVLDTHKRVDRMDGNSLGG